MLRLSLLFTLLFSTIFASSKIEEFPFLGVTVATHTISLKSQANRKDPHETSLAIRYGKQTLDWRTMFTLSGNSHFQSFSMEIDKILLDDLFGMPEFRPYLGATLGYLHYEDFLTTDNDGFYYGGNVGLLIYVTDNIDADLSYHYYSIEELDTLDKMQGAELGIHFFY